MESHFSLRWYGTNQKGEHTFFIEVYASNILDELFFETSLPVDIFSEPGITNLVNKLCKIDLPLSERNKIAEKMISKIERISDMQKYYFTDMVLDKNGKYCEAYADVLNELNQTPELKVNAPYSLTYNGSIFRHFKSCFSYDELAQECNPVGKKIFEKIISGNEALQRAYAENYDDYAEFYYHTSNDNSLCIEFYCMVVNKELTFAFFTKLYEVYTFEP